LQQHRVESVGLLDHRQMAAALNGDELAVNVKQVAAWHA
jgi:hypothetical protein